MCADGIFDFWEEITDKMREVDVGDRIAIHYNKKDIYGVVTGKTLTNQENPVEMVIFDFVEDGLYVDEDGTYRIKESGEKAEEFITKVTCKEFIAKL